jgi:chondroitin AC lyase
MFLNQNPLGLYFLNRLNLRSAPQALKAFAIGIFIFTCSGVSYAEFAESDILERYRALIDARPSPSASKTEDWVKNLNEDGSWSDIDYFSKIKTGWPARDHLRRIIEILRTVREGAVPDTIAEELKNGAFSAIDYWTKHQFQSLNWYHNEIGVPQDMRDIAILLGPDLEGPRREGVLKVLGQHRIRATGANLVWSAELGFHYGCLTGDQELMNRAARRVWEEVTIGEFEGVQTDGSFFQHEERVQNFIYGRGFGDVIVTLAWQLRGTEWEMPLEKQEIINRYLIDGCQWMGREQYNSPFGVDRAIGSNTGFHRANMLEILKTWREVTTQRIDELDTYIARQEGTGELLTGFKYFHQGDGAAYHTKEAAIFLKTLSDRTHLTESFIGVNLKGMPYLTCGDHYILADGTEYEGLQPVWDWKQLPGVTTPNYHSMPVRKPFVGGLGNGISGCAAMDHTRTGDAGHLTVRKFWAFHEGMMICLLGGWDYRTYWGQITTSVEQSRLQGPVVISKEGKAETIQNAHHADLQIDWALHRGIGYIPLNPEESVLRTGPQSGNWREIDRDASPLEVVEQTFRISIEHTHEPKPTGFAVILGADKEKMASLQANPTWEVIQNTGAAQIIRFASGLHMGVFYEPTTYNTAAPIQVSRRCMVMWDGATVTACDPTQRGGTVEILLEGKRLSVDLPNDGSYVTTSL